MKKKIILIVILILILILPLLIKIYPVNKNNKYYSKLEENIRNNISIENINYFNMDNNYYIVKNDEYVFVLDLNYDIIYQEEIVNLKDSELELTYTRNNLYYKETIREKDKLIYNYYNVNSMDKVYTSSLGGNNG